MPDNPTDLKQTIADAAANPAKVASDNQSVEQHKLSELVEADRYLSGRTNANKGMGIRFVKMIPPGQD